MLVRDIMTTKVITAKPTTDFKALADLLLTWGISGVPVVDCDNNLAGVVTRSDLLSKLAYPDERPPTSAERLRLPPAGSATGPPQRTVSPPVS
jgi:CBS-domain-containing membrane protein